MFLSARLFAIRWIKTLDLERNERSAKVLQKRMTKSRVLGEGGGVGWWWWVFLFVLITASSVSSPERKRHIYIYYLYIFI